MVGAEQLPDGAFLDFLRSVRLRRVKMRIVLSAIILMQNHSVLFENRGLPLLEVGYPRLNNTQRALKGTLALDIGSALGGLAALSALLIAVAILIRLTSAGPILFRQKRAGADEKVFICYKLRSMYQDAKQAGGPVFHMEAGNRCFAPRDPEERNRRIIDHISSWLLPYVPNSRQNLLSEGMDKERIFVSGNPIFEVLTHYKGEIDASDVLDRLGLQGKGYFLVTAHRAENVDVPERLSGIVSALNRLAAGYDMPVVWSVHPRTRQKIEASGLEVDSRILLSAPFDLFDFVKLEENAFCVLTDSGTVQEECCILRVPAVTIRDTTERPETVECGSNVLAGCDAQRIVEAVELVTQTGFEWEMPEGYTDPNVSDKVIRYVLGNVGRRPLLDR